MKIRRRQFLRLAAGAGTLPAISRIARAQTYPARPIILVVPFPPGGSTDVTGRILAEHMKMSLGQPVVIENVGAAQGSVGVGRVARAPPDGYTIDIGQWGAWRLEDRDGPQDRTSIRLSGIGGARAALTDEHAHSALSAPEVGAALDALMRRIETGAKPTPQSIAAPCEELRASLDGPCTYHPEFTPKPLNTRFYPRESAVR